MDRTATNWLIFALLSGLLMLLAMRDHFGYQVDPLAAIVCLMVGCVILVLLVRHPALFICPVLFIPRLQPVPILSRFSSTDDITWLASGTALLCTAILFRLLRAEPHRSAAREIFQDHGREFMALILLGAVLSMSILYTPSPLYGADKLFRVLTLGGLLFVTPLVLLASREDFRDFAIGTVCFAMIVAASSVQFSAGGALGASDNPAHIGKAQVTGMAMLLLLYYQAENRWLRAAVLFLCVPWLAVGLVSAEARGPLFSAFFVLCLSFVFPAMRSRLISRSQMFIGGLLLVVAVSVLSRYWFYGAEATRYQAKATEIFQLFSNSSEAHGTATARLEFYEAALAGWLQHPVFGWGIGGWSMYYWNHDDRLYPHNLALETLVEEGFVGFCALSFLLVTVSQRLRRNLINVRESYPYLLPLWIYLLSITMFSGDLDDDRFVWFWCGTILSGCRLASQIPANSTLDNAKDAVLSRHTGVFAETTEQQLQKGL